MNELELFKSDAIKGVADSSDYRILAIDGKAVLAEKFSNPPQPQQVSPPATPVADRGLLIGAIVLFGLGVIVGTSHQYHSDARKIQDLQADNLILQSKIQKIKDLIE